MSVNPTIVKNAKGDQLKSWGDLFSINFLNYSKVKERRVILALHYLSNTPSPQEAFTDEWKSVFDDLHPTDLQAILQDFHSDWVKVMPASETLPPLSSLNRGGMDDADDERNGEETVRGSDTVTTKATSERELEPPVMKSSSPILEMTNMTNHGGKDTDSSENESFYSLTKDSEHQEINSANSPNFQKAIETAMEKWWTEMNQKPNVKTSKGMGDPIAEMAESFKDMANFVKNVSLQNGNQSATKVYTESISLPTVWPKKYHFYEDLYVTRVGAEMNLKELFETVLALAEEKRDYSWASWNQCFQSKIAMEPKEKDKLHRHLRPVNYADLMEQYKQDNGYEPGQMTLIHILMAYLGKAKERDEDKGVSQFAPLPVFSRPDFEPWEDWLGRVDSLLENTSYARLPYLHLLEVCEEEKKLSNPRYFKSKEDADQMYKYIKLQQLRRDKMMTKIWTEYGNINNFMNLNDKATKEGKHPIAYSVSKKYLYKFFDHTKDRNNINFGHGDTQNYIKWLGIHKNRMLAKTEDVSTASTDEQIEELQMYDTKHLTLFENARILDSIYYTEKTRFRNKEEYKKLIRQLQVTEYDQKANQSSKNDSSAKKPRAEINSGNFRQKTYESPIPKSIREFIYTSFPNYRKIKKTCRYQHCKLPKEKAYHWSHLCHTYWKNEEDDAKSAMEKIMDDYQSHQSLDTLQKALAATVRTEEKVDHDDQESSN